MKRIWIAAVCLCLCIGFAGCAAPAGPAPREPAAEEPSPAEEQTQPEEPDGDSVLLPDIERLREGLSELTDLYVPTEITMDSVRANAGTYQKITAEQAFLMIRDIENAAVVDVRTQEEYDAGHIEGAVLVPNESIVDAQPAVLPDKEQILLVYCRSGVRSEDAAKKLLKLGYAYVYDFGGIIDWPYDVVQ